MFLLFLFLRISSSGFGKPPSHGKPLWLIFLNKFLPIILLTGWFTSLWLCGLYSPGCQSQPVRGACTIFTDGSASGIDAVVTDDHPVTQQVSISSAQRVEPDAVIMASTYVSSRPSNLYTDSKYILTVLVTIETATFGSTTNASFLQQFSTLQNLFCKTCKPLQNLNLLCSLFYLSHSSSFSFPRFLGAR